VTITGVEGGGLTTADTTINAAEARGWYRDHRPGRGGLDRHGQWRGGHCGRGWHLYRDDPDREPAGSDGPFAVNVATTDAAGNTATATQTLTLDRGTTVAITGVEGGDNTINAAEAAVAS
jgi:hypothetical protein